MKTKTLVSIFSFMLIANSLLAQNYEVYISDAGNFNQPPWQILKFDENGENGTVFTNENLNWPQDILFQEDSNRVLISNLGTGKISRHNATTGAYIDDFATGINGPTRMKLGPDGLLYVLQWQSNGKVLRYNMDGTFVDEFTDIGVLNSIGLDWDTAGNLYVSSWGGKFVQKFNAVGEDQGIFIETGLAGPTNIWFDDEGNLIVLDYNAGSVKRFLPDGTFDTTLITGLGQGEGVAFFPDGSFLLGGGACSCVNWYNADATFNQTFIPSGTLGLLTPNAVVLRELTVSSVIESAVEYVETSFITPSVGLEFYLAKDFLNKKLEFVDIYGINGQFVDRIVPDSSMIWTAKDRPSGMYVVNSKLADGQLITQRILVRR